MSPTSPAAPPSLSKRRVPRWFVIVASLVALYTLFGFLILPRIIRWQMEKRLPALLHRPTTVREVLFNPYAMSITIRGFFVQEPDGTPLVAFEELYVDVAVWRHLLGGVHLQEVKLVQPVVGVTVLKGGKLNFADLLEGDPKSGKPPEKPAETKPLVFEIARFELDRGAVAFADRNRAHPFQTRLEPLSFVLDHFTTEPQKNGAYDFKAHLAPSTEFAWAGSITTTPLKSEGTVSITGIQLSQFGSYSEDSMQLRVTSGVLDLGGKYTFDASQTPTVIRLDEGHVKLSKLLVDPPGRDEPLVSLETVALTGISADVATQEARVRSFSLEGGRIMARRSANGHLELADLSRPKLLVPGPPPPPPPSPSAPAAKPWTTRLDDVRIGQLDLVWEDRVPHDPARLTIEGFQLHVAPYFFPGDAVSTFETSMRINGGSHFTAHGTTHPNAGSAELDLALEKLAFAPFQPYASQVITAKIAKGSLDVSGHVSFTPAPKGGGLARTKFAGNLSIDGFSLVDAPGKELVGFERFALVKLDTDTSTLATTLDQVLLKSARLHYTINADKTDNWATLMRGAKPAKPETASEPVAAATPPPDEQPSPPAAKTPNKSAGPQSKTTIKVITLDSFGLEFVDKSVQPPYSTKLAQFGGSIAPFTQPGLAKSKVNLAGKLDGARLLIAGTVRPAGKDTDADMVVSLAPWNLTPTTPYGIKFTGYPVEKGKLSLDLKYKVGGHKLQASNLVTIDKLTLGAAQESPTATKLPVKLALAILTDRNGKLEIDLPIEGSLDDPDFRIGKVVVHTLLNVLEKAATAPFALLGAAFGSSEDLSWLEFASGSDDLAPAEQAKLAQLAKALVDRPALQLSIVGLSDPDSDREGLLDQQLDDELIAKRRETVTPGKQPPPDDEPLSPADRSAAMRALFLERVVVPKEAEAAALKAAGKPVPLDLVPRRDLPAKELEALVRQTQTVPPDEFADLARSRAETVQDALSEVEGLDPARVFISTTKPEADKKRRVLLQLE